jgi:hypothetical protein
MKMFTKSIRCTIEDLITESTFNIGLPDLGKQTNDSLFLGYLCKPVLESADENV